MKREDFRGFGIGKNRIEGRKESPMKNTAAVEQAIEETKAHLSASAAYTFYTNKPEMRGLAIQDAVITKELIEIRLNLIS